MTTSRLISSLCRAALLCAPLFATVTVDAAKVDERQALPGGGTLVLNKKALVLRGPDGALRAQLTVRAEQLHLRGALALVRDSSTQQALPVRIDLAAGTLTPLSPLPSSFGVESLCLYHDQQGLDHAFVAGKDGQAEQWLIGTVPQLVRKLALPPGDTRCAVDDARHTLYVDEPGVGVWAYEARSEAIPKRQLLKRRPRPSAAATEERIAIIAPQRQTDPVARWGDVADDPAIWVHPTDPSRSRVLGTNKKQGLMVYDLAGKQVQMLEVGRLNNVDLRQRVAIGDGVADLAVATQRDDNSVVLFGIDGDGKVAELTRFATGFNEVYGLCLYQGPGAPLELIVNDKNGQFRQYRIGRRDGVFTSTLARSFRVATQPEGCVADDRSGRLFIGEEKRGVWSLPAAASQPARLQLVLGVSVGLNARLHADVEGMAIYHGAQHSYLIVSSQGDSSYVVLDAQAPHAVRGRFRVGFNVASGIDGTADTDGLDVTSTDLGGPFSRGMLVIQDGYKRLPDGPQNFKYVSWDDVARALGL
jgi:3-phytase